MTTTKIVRFVIRLTQPTHDKQSLQSHTLLLKHQLHPKYIAVLQEALDNLSIALSSEYCKEFDSESQENALQRINQASMLNKELYNENEPYSWFSYYAEKNLAEKIAENLSYLKKTLPAEWANAIRGEARAVGFAYANYLVACKKALEKMSLLPFKKTLRHHQRMGQVNSSTYFQI